MLKQRNLSQRIICGVALLAIAGLMISMPGCGKKDGKAGANTGAQGGTNSSGKKRIILLTNGNSPFWDACRFGMQAADKDLKFADSGFQAVMEVNDGTPKGQIDKLRQFNSQSDIVAIAVSALDADNKAVVEEMRKLIEKGVKVITVDADVNRKKFRDARKYYIGTDNLSGGKALGIAAREILVAKGIEKGEYVQFVGRTGSHNAIERMSGFKEAIGDKYVEKDRMGDDLDRTKARENVRNAIRNHPDLNILVGIWSYNAPAIVDVVTQENKRDKFTIITFDAEPIAIKQMQSGSIDAMIVQNPYEMGYQGMKILKALLEKDEKTVKTMFPNDGKPDGDLYDTGIKVVVPNQNSPLKKDMFSAKTVFLKLDDFQAWLDKYNLKGS